MPNFRIKKLLCAWISSQNQRTVSGEMFFRVYNPQIDSIVDSYSPSDWNLIFKDCSEEDLHEMQECANILILLWCDRTTGKAHGMIYLEEPYNNLGTLKIHGGTWDHHPKWFIKIYHSLTLLLQYLIGIGTQIYTMCYISNLRANKILQSFGFVEYQRSDVLSYKKLDHIHFLNSPILKRRVQELQS